MRVAAPLVERVALDDASGRVLARELSAGDDFPIAPRSAMDGFALLAAGTPGTLAIAGEVRMGEAMRATVTRETALRIPTGGTLPEGADAVVPIEEARADATTVYVERAFDSGANVIARGSDMRRGETLLASGTRIASPQCGLLAALGVARVDVYRQPIVAVFSSGDELVDVEETPGPGRIRDSNRYAIAASLRAMGAQARHYPRLPDDCESFVLALAAALHECDAIVMTGGSSVGERDVAPAAVAALGEPGVVVHGLRVKPGKPTLLGAAGGKPILGLPGNPVSALMMLEAVGAPIVSALCGARPPAHSIAARLAEPLHGRADWTWYVPVSLRHEGGALLAHPLPLRSFSVSLAARAGGYVVMDERDEDWPAGAPVTVHQFLGA